MPSDLIDNVKSFLTFESGEWDWRNGEWDELKPLALTEYIANSISIVELNHNSIVIEEESKADYIEPKIISSRDLVSYEVIAKAIAIVAGNLQNDSKEGELLNQAMTTIVQNTSHKYLEDRVLLKLQTTTLGSELHDLLIDNESEIAIGLEFSPEIIAERINTNLSHKEFGLENLLSLMMLINDILSSCHSSIKQPLEEAIVELYVRLHPESNPSRYSCDDKYFDEDPDAPTPDGGGAGSEFAESLFENE